MDNVKWMPIETAPQDGRRILVCEQGRPGVDMVYWSGGPKRGLWYTEDGLAAYGPGFFSHWMPLPEPVTDKSE
jgi:hypothetical protein